MNWILYAVASLMAFGALATISMVGKPRKPIQPVTAVITVVLNALMIAGLIYVAVAR